MVPIEGFSQFGLNGLIIGALLAFIYFLVKMHSAERKEWIEAYKEVSSTMDERQKETNMLLSRLIDRYI